MCTVGPRTFCKDEDCKVCLAKSFASVPEHIYWSDENKGTPRYTLKYSNQKYWFYCNCGHIFESRLSDVTRGFFCPYCGNQKLCDNDKCKVCLEKSFASDERKDQWSPANKINPRYVFKCSNKKFEFICKVCKHTFESILNNVTRHGRWCPYCSHQKLCDNECNMCHENSFASYKHKKQITWSPQNKCEPRQVFKGSNKKYIFNCGICGHTFNTCPSHMNGRDVGCIYCINQKLCDNKDCQICLDKSFKSHKMSKYWSKENKRKARDVFMQSNLKFKFNCPFCKNIYQGRPCDISHGTWCTCRRNKTEAKLYKYLKSKYKNSVEKEKKFDWCRNKKFLPFDFFIEKYNLLIELDGDHHFFQKVEKWGCHKERQRVDKYKMDMANSYGLSVLRIFQVDVWADKNNWQKNLSKAIRKYKNTRNIYIGDVYKNGDIYDKVISSKDGKLLDQDISDEDESDGCIDEDDDEDKDDEDDIDDNEDDECDDD